jgi:hypothetical protein
MKKNLIMENTHLLGLNNYYQTDYDKTQIVIGNTLSTGLNHVTKWQMRLNGKYKETSPLSILRDGTIHLHYDPKHHSDFIGVKDIDKHIVSIVLENEGWLTKDLQNGQHLNWIGDIYNGGGEIIEARWREHTYWASYTDEQIESLVKLCKYLCVKFNIPMETLEHNTKFTTIENFEGVAFKSNYSKNFSDVSPAFKFAEFKNKLEIN